MKDNNLQKISLFSPKINLIGLTKEEERIITDWYCNGKHNNYSEKNKLLKSRIKTKAINMFEKILYQIGIFNETTQIEIINDFVNKSKYPILKNFFKFKCKNSKGENIIVRLYAGGGYDNVPTLSITNKDNYIIYPDGNKFEIKNVIFEDENILFKNVLSFYEFKKLFNFLKSCIDSNDVDFLVNKNLFLRLNEA